MGMVEDVRIRPSMGLCVMWQQSKAYSLTACDMTAGVSSPVVISVSPFPPHPLPSSAPLSPLPYSRVPPSFVFAFASECFWHYQGGVFFFGCCFEAHRKSWFWKLPVPLVFRCKLRPALQLLLRPQLNKLNRPHGRENQRFLFGRKFDSIHFLLLPPGRSLLRANERRDLSSCLFVFSFRLVQFDIVFFCFVFPPSSCAASCVFLLVLFSSVQFLSL